MNILVLVIFLALGATIQIAGIIAAILCIAGGTPIVTKN
jgi:hypothetical protein